MYMTFEEQGSNVTQISSTTPCMRLFEAWTAHFSITCNPAKMPSHFFFSSACESKTIQSVTLAPVITGKPHQITS